MKIDNRAGYGTANIIFALLIAYGLLFYSTGVLDNSENIKAHAPWIPYDSTLYIENGENLEFSELSAIDIATGALNWLTISIVYYSFNQILGLAPIFFIILNSYCFFKTIKICIKSQYISKNKKAILAALILFCSPYIIPWLPVPNKELIIGLGTLLVINNIDNNNFVRTSLLIMLLGTIKVQFALAGLLFFIFHKIRYRKTILLLSVSLIYPMLHNSIPGLQMSYFLDVNPNEIRTAEIFLKIDELSSLPFGFVLIFFVRLFLNLFGGLNPIRIIESGFDLSSCAPLTSFILGITAGASHVKFFLNHKKNYNLFLFNENGGFFLFCILLVNTSIPFLQPRYYWWLIPIFLHYLLTSPKKTHLLQTSKTSIQKFTIYV